MDIFRYHMNSNFKKTPKKSLSWMHYHNYHEVICLCSSARKTHKRNWDLSLTPKSCIPSANKGLRLMHWPVKAAEGPLSSTHAPDSCCLCRCGAVVWYLIGGTRSWAQSEWGVTVVWTWAPHTHHAAHCPCACPGPGDGTWGFLKSPPQLKPFCGGQQATGACEERQKKQMCDCKGQGQ